MGLGKIYYSLEDKYYDFVEKTGLYKITDKIDRVMPSFILSILLVIIIIAGVLLLVFGGVHGNNYSNVYFNVIDGNSGVALQGVPIQITTTKSSYNALTNDSGITDTYKVPKDDAFQVFIDYTDYGYNNYSEDLSADVSDNGEITISLEPTVTTPPTKTYTISFADTTDNSRINNSGVVSFTCANEDGIAPSSVNVENGEVTVDADPNCQLLGTVRLNGYVTAYQQPINLVDTYVYLNKEESHYSGLHTLTIYTKKESSEAINNIHVIVKDSLGLKKAEGITNNGGVVVFHDLDSGNYTVQLNDARAVPIYDSINNHYVSIGDGDVTDSIVLSSSINGYIKIKVINKDNSLPMKDADISLKSVDSLIDEKYSDENGIVIFTVSDKTVPYRVVANVEGFMITSMVVTASETLPTVPILFKVPSVTPSTVARLNIKVLGEDGKAFKFAKVALFDSKTGFLTDYKPKLSNYDGNVTFNVSSGSYYAVAIKGSSTGQSSIFDFDVRQAITYDPIIIPMTVSTGNLVVHAVNKEGVAIPNVKVEVYDEFSALSNNPPIPLKSDLTNTTGEFLTDLSADSKYYVVVSDPINENYGTTQSQYISLVPNTENNLKVVLYNKQKASEKPKLIFNGLFDGNSEVNANLKANGEYTAKFTLLVPQNRTGYNSFDEVGVILRTGINSYLGNDDIYIKSISVPNAKAITKYTQFNINTPHEIDGVLDNTTKTDGDAKWVKVVFNDVAGKYYNAYDITAQIKIKDTAVFGEDLRLYSLGFAYTDNGYETYNEYTGNESEIEYFNVYNSEVYRVGDQVLCTSNFCFNMSLLDVASDLRSDVTTSYAAKSNSQYKLHFTLINNQTQRTYLNSRLIIENKDDGLQFDNIKITEPNGNVLEIANSGTYPISSLAPKQKVNGDILFTTKLNGDRHLVFKFISDQQVQFINDLVVSVASNKSLNVSVTPNIIPSGKNFSLQADITDTDTGLPIKDAYVALKDQYKTTIPGTYLPVGDYSKTISINDIVAMNSGDYIYLYVTAPEYETSITKLKVSDKLFNITPAQLSTSLNVHTKKSVSKEFTIHNLSELDLKIKSIKLIGSNLDLIDISRINNQLAGYNGVVINGIDTTSDFPDNTNASKDISITIGINPRAQALRSVSNISGRLIIELESIDSSDSSWLYEVPMNVTVGFDGLFDSQDCLNLSEYSWKDVAINKPVENQFTLNNNCTMGGRTVPLLGGLQVKVVFESNPLGNVYVSVGNRTVQLAQGYYKTLYDSVDKDRGYPVIIKFEPTGRAKGEVKGKVIFRSLNNTTGGDQEIKSEYTFDISVLNLKDCVSFSKDTLTIYKTADTFNIENKGCGAPTTYSLSCVGCSGINITPLNNIDVEETGTSKNISVASGNAIPGQYMINVYSKLKGTRQAPRNVGQIKLIVRPKDGCIDLDRYEFDLYRSTTSKDTGLVLNASSYDTGTIINTCYQQDITGTAKMKNGATIGMAFMSAFRDGLLTYGTSTLTKSLLGAGKATAVDKAGGTKLLSGVNKWFASKKKKLANAQAVLKQDTKLYNDKCADKDKQKSKDCIDLKAQIKAAQDRIDKYNNSGEETKSEESIQKVKKTDESTKSCIELDETACDENKLCDWNAITSTCENKVTIKDDDSANTSIDLSSSKQKLNVELEKVSDKYNKNKDSILAYFEKNPVPNSYTFTVSGFNKQQLYDDILKNKDKYNLYLKEDVNKFGINQELIKDNLRFATKENINDVNIDLKILDYALDFVINKATNAINTTNIPVNTYIPTLDYLNDKPYSGVNLVKDTFKFAKTLNSQYNFNSLSSVCSDNSCEDYTSNYKLAPKDILGYTSPSSNGDLGYFAIYLGKKTNVEYIFRISGSEKKYIIESSSNFNDKIYPDYKLITVITPKK